MFDLRDQTGSVRRKPYDSPIPKGNTPAAAGGVAVLDGTEMVYLHRRLLDLYGREIDRQRPNRIEQAQDEDFYDNLQWREEDEQTLRERGQEPLVYNVISSSVDWITGTEKRGRADYKILPRTKEDAKPAERKSQLLKYLADVNRNPFHVSRAFEDTVKVGIGWLDDGVSDDDEGNERIYSRYESWRNIIWDSTANELDLSDGRYLFRSKWTDLDLAASIFRKRKGLLQRSAAAADPLPYIEAFGDEAMDQQELERQRGFSSTGDQVFGYQRQRVRLIEAWFRLPMDAERMVRGPFKGELYDEYSPGHVDSLNNGQGERASKHTMRMHVAIFSPLGMLWCSPSPYRHNRFPLTPIWGYRRGRDGMPYGMIRRVKSIQEDVNKRASKALHIMSSSKVVMDKGAVDDLDEFLEEVSRPDAVIVKNDGKELRLEEGKELGQFQLELMGRSIAMIQAAGGVTDENLGRKSNATSGIAIQRRQDQGSTVTTTFFDNLRFARQVQGEKQLALVEQFMTEAKQFRITNMRGSPEYVEVNDGEAENDIVRSKADFVISEADWRASIRQAAVEQLLEVMQKLPPQVVMVMLDLVIEHMDLPNVEEIVRRVRNVTGQSDPDAEEASPEEQQRMQAQQRQMMMQAMSEQATLRKLVAEAVRTEMQAEKEHALAVRANVGSIGGPKRGAIDIAADAMTRPEVAHTADHVLHEAHYVSRSEQEETAAAAAANAGPPAPTNPQQLPPE